MVCNGPGAAHIIARLLSFYYQVSRDSSRIGCFLGLRQELHRDEAQSKIYHSEIGQPASTAVQIALIDLLTNASILPNAVIGHSSGEIAAAYVPGALDHKNAMAISYHRSFLGNLSKQKIKRPDSMAAVGLPEPDVERFVAETTTGKATVACLNDPSNTTISGDETVFAKC